MGLLRCEKETVILLNDDEKTASISTSQDWMKNRIKRLAEEDPENIKIESENKYTLIAKMPKRYVRVAIPRKLSEEQRKAAAERLNEYRNKKNKK